MAETFVNFLGGSPLNRLSWLRTSQPFLSAVASSPHTRWLVFQSGQPLLTGTSLAHLTIEDVSPLLGAQPLFGQGQHPGDVASPTESTLEAARHRGTPIVFLGLHEADSGNGASALPSSDFSAKTTDISVLVDKIKGTPYFALDVSTTEQAEVDALIQRSPGDTRFGEPRAAMGRFDAFEAAVFAEARSMIDWNARNKFCPACGSPVYSLWAGWKLSCSTLMPWADNTGRTPCPSARGLNNFAHPRTDPVVIMLAVSPEGDKVLLGRNKKFPGKFYSALAGFMEPGESFEDAVKREMWEEAGVKVWDVNYHSGQPWPYPANLMVGFYSTADPTQPLRTDLDNELEDARWFGRDEILAILNHPTGVTLTRRDHAELQKIVEGTPANNEMQQAQSGAGALAHSDPNTKPAAPQSTPSTGNGGKDEPPFRVPPRTAIAGVLIYDWAHGRLGKVNAELKGNL